MNTALRTLIIEDSEDDALLIVRELTRAGYRLDWHRVDSAAGVASSLEIDPWDVIISDYNMPGFTGTDALRLVRARDQDTPFIFVSGALGEDVAVEAMRAGAQDYVVKGSLRRLVPAIERELREAAVRRARHASEARFRRVVECGMLGIFFWETPGRITEVNDEFLRIIGYTREDMAQAEIDWRHLTPAGYEAADTHALREYLTTGACTPYEKEFFRKDGSRVPVLVGGALLDGKDSRVGFVLDVTERRRAAEAIRARELQQAAVASLGRLALERTDLVHLFDAAAALVAETLGVEFSKVLELEPDGKTLRLRAGVGWRDGSIGHEIIPASIAGGPQNWLVRDEPIVVEDARTDPRFASDTLLREHGVISGLNVVIPMLDRAFGVLGVCTGVHRRFSQDDIHFLQAVAHILGTAIERERAENAFRQTQRLESVGRLAGGVAHDFNNMLTVIVMHAEALLTGLPEPEPMREDVEEIRSAAHRATALTRQLLTFSRRQVLEPKRLNLNDTVGDLQKMLRRLIGEDIALEVTLAPALSTVKADPGQIEQVIMNLIVNARDAMPNGGRLVLETANIELDEAYASMHDGALPGPHVMLTVADSGTGMDRETLSRIFEPFFTTKSPDKGTGLGLATVYGIVRQSHGSIWVYSEPDRGTTFKVYLPVDGEAPMSPSVVMEQRTDLGGSETILLAEDEPAIRRIAERILRRAGYEVLVAGDGEEALALEQQHPGRIHLLVSDLVMPKLGGRDLARRLLELRPGVKVLHLSGYSDPGPVPEGESGPPVAFLQKPFTAEALTQKVREALDSTE